MASSRAHVEVFSARGAATPSPAPDALFLRGPRGTDCVAGWKLFVRESVVRSALELTKPARIRFEVTFGFVFALIVTCAAGSHPSLVLACAVVTAALAHELPQAALARYADRPALVKLDTLGGHTALAGAKLGGWRALGLVALGSLTNLAVGSLLLRAPFDSVGVPSTGVRAVALVHMVWGTAQLVPLLPLGAGRVLARGLGTRARLLHASASLTFVMLLAWGLGERLGNPAVFVGLTLSFAACGWWIYEVATELLDQRHAPTLDALESALQSGPPTRAVKLSTELLAVARSLPLQRKALAARAWAAIAQGDALNAHAALCALPPRALDLHLLASYLTTCRRFDEATALLEHARRLGVRSAETTKLLAELYFRRGRLGAVAELAAADRELLSVADFGRIRAVLGEARREPHGDAASV